MNKNVFFWVFFSIIFLFGVLDMIVPQILPFASPIEAMHEIAQLVGLAGLGAMKLTNKIKLE